ncbi:hypothetical protein HBH98_230620 [Parastagonospora nodorum]|nr:hypothetical protein HBH49_236200 [Parastagonospora nodorum]KAH4336238.1 hypothetical protein HBH98_230620 [Parastagonospora nodorum]KAH4357646.1 hypothetical protein HBH97_221810 [Parastagonospora nodorum]KAH5485456.1 hypothetical protein HBI29_229660 [Parastagonospora nodorum]KAH5565899.1 hypothetical protein HBI24_236080 [Parastagonospora nodorum]
MFEMCSSNVWSLWEIMAIHVQHKSLTPEILHGLPKAKAMPIHERVAGPRPSHKAANDGYLLVQCALGIWHLACVDVGVHSLGEWRAACHLSRTKKREP